MAVDACGWWPFRRTVAVVAVYTADVEEEKKKEKKRKTYWWVLAVDACSGGDGRRGWVLANTRWW